MHWIELYWEVALTSTTVAALTAKEVSGRRLDVSPADSGALLNNKSVPVDISIACSTSKTNNIVTSWCEMKCQNCALATGKNEHYCCLSRFNVQLMTKGNIARQKPLGKRSMVELRVKLDGNQYACRGSQESCSSRDNLLYLMSWFAYSTRKKMRLTYRKMLNSNKQWQCR